MFGEWGLFWASETPRERHGFGVQTHFRGRTALTFELIIFYVSFHKTEIKTPCRTGCLLKCKNTSRSTFTCCTKTMVNSARPTHTQLKAEWPLKEGAFLSTEKGRDNNKFCLPTQKDQPSWSLDTQATSLLTSFLFEKCLEYKQTSLTTLQSLHPHQFGLLLIKKSLDCISNSYLTPPLFLDTGNHLFSIWSVQQTPLYYA